VAVLRIVGMRIFEMSFRAGELRSVEIRFFPCLFHVCVSFCLTYVPIKMGSSTIGLGAMGHIAQKRSDNASITSEVKVRRTIIFPPKLSAHRYIIE
jgi:hypothetical protein